MNDHDRRKAALGAALRLSAIVTTMAVDDDGNVLDRIRMHQGHLRGSSYDGAGIGDLSQSDPTGQQAGQRDRASHDLRLLDRHLTFIAKAVHDIELIFAAYPTPRLASEMDRLTLERMNIKPDPGCENCARIEGPRGGPRWEPVDSRCPTPTTVGGRLAEPRLLCSWCYDKANAWGRLPSERELTIHHDGRRVPGPNDVPRPV